MEKIKDIFYKLKSDYRHWICIAIILLSLSFIPFKFKYAHLRIYESLNDLINSLIYYVSELFELNLTGDLSVLDFTNQPFELPFFLPSSWEEFKNIISNYWSTFFSTENFTLYLNLIGDIVFYLVKILTIILPIILIIIIISKFFKKNNENNNYNEDTKALQRFKRFEDKILLPIYHWIFDFISFIKDNKIYLQILLFIWLYNFNFFAIGIEFIAFYLYFICSFKTITLYGQVLKLLMDLSVMLNFVPVFIWFIVFLVVFHKIRVKIGYERLEHMELKNRGFINERPVAVMQCGTMGSKKTTMSTDMALSIEIMFRNKAFEKILDCDLMFPYFPWINLENSIKRAIENHIVYNLATSRKFIDQRKKYFTDHKKNRNVFDYDFKRYGLYYDNKLNMIYLWDVIRTYTQLYFVYIVQSSLLISNYSIRTDNLFIDNGNFPMWDTDLFKRDSKYLDAYSRHAHILDFDSLRLGKNLIINNEKSNSFEFGVINITEIGKERGNTLENQTLKKNDDFCNQKNDLFNSWLKMVRHSATIDNYPFVKVICDEQRPESLGADARDLCEIVYIDECSDINLAMPFFFFEDMFLSWLISKFKNKYYQFRFERGDNTLPMYLYHGIISKLNKFKKGIYNTFGYYQLDLKIEKGTQDGTYKESKYYLMCKKIYSKRFSTDCFSDFFHEKALKSKLGINDLAEFKTEKASFEEMQQENSYFFNDLCKMKK